MITITVLINDNYQGTPNPLIYTVAVEDPTNQTEVMAAVDKARRMDLDFDESEEMDLELLVAFAGDCQIAADWRE